MNCLMKKDAVRQWSIFSTDEQEDDTSGAWINTWGIYLTENWKLESLFCESENRNIKKEM